MMKIKPKMENSYRRGELLTLLVICNRTVPKTIEPDDLYAHYYKFSLKIEDIFEKYPDEKYAEHKKKPILRKRRSRWLSAVKDFIIYTALTSISIYYFIQIYLFIYS